MGARLVKQTYAYAVDIPLTPNEFRLLGYMALTALDEDPTPRYFDSREASAIALGRRVVDEGYGDEKDKRARAAAFEAVKVALRGLIAIGAVTRIKTGRSGQRAEYAIHADTFRSRSTTEYARRKRKEGSPFLSKKVHPSPNGRFTLPEQEGSPFPQGTTQEPKGTDTGNTSPNASTSPVPVENEKAIA